MIHHMPDPNLDRLLAAARNATADLGRGVSAEQLYREASAIAERRFPGPVGTSLAGLLGVAAWYRRSLGLPGWVGEHRVLLALALAVLSEALDAPPLDPNEPEPLAPPPGVRPPTPPIPPAPPDVEPQPEPEPGEPEPLLQPPAPAGLALDLVNAGLRRLGLQLVRAAGAR